MSVTNKSDFWELYGFLSGRVADELLTELEPHGIRFTNRSPFVIISPIDEKSNMDASPRVPPNTSFYL